MKAYSIDLRERVLRAVDQGKPRSEIVQMLGVSLATIKRYLKQRRETGHLWPKAIPGRTPRKGAALQAGLVAQLEAHPDVSLETHCELWEKEHSMRVSTSTMSRMILRVGWTRKKSRL
jgi:transposase